MPKKKQDPPVKKTKQGEAATAGIAKRLKESDEKETYIPNGVEKKVLDYVKRRVEDMIDYRKGLGIEQRWREADEEYIPHELDFGTTRKRFETDQDTGLRSRMVPVGDVTQQWRQASSAPTLLAKIQTAVSIIIDQQPEAELTALLKKYSKTADLAYALWKRNWQITEAKEKLKLIVFDLIKYGWAPQRTYPRKVQYMKRVLTSVDKENPENDTYEEKNLVWFNDIDRQPLDPNRTWIDELSKPYDPYSTNEVYYEMDFSYDAAKVEFGQYDNFKYVKHDSAVVREDVGKKTNRSTANEELRKRKDVVTIGFFESRHKDLYCIKAVKDDIPIYTGPLPNDDGYLSVTHTLWILRKSSMPYGISLWEVIRQNKALYDKMKNMTMDQLVLSIMKFGFFSGTNAAVGDGKVEIVPGQARQLTSSTGKPEVNWMEIPGPGKEAWDGLEAVQKMMDSESGIVPTLEGEITGKTLGEILHAKEAALKRIKVPVENIAWLIEQDAYLTVSWMSQVYAVPTVEAFVDEAELQAFNEENQIQHMQLCGTLQEDGTITGPFEAHYLPQLALHLENSDGELVQSNKSQFFQVGTDIKPSQLKWRGIFKVIPRSIVDSSQTLIKAMKMEVFNMLVPLLGQAKELAAKPASQILKVNEEDPDDWLPDDWIDYLKNGPTPPPPPPTQGGAPNNPATAQATAAGQPAAAPIAEVNPRASGTIQGATGTTAPQAPTIVPGSPAPDIHQLMGGKPGLFNHGL
jgi:hypothetical protein